MAHGINNEAEQPTLDRQGGQGGSGRQENCPFWSHRQDNSASVLQLLGRGRTQADLSLFLEKALHSCLLRWV